MDWTRAKAIALDVLRTAYNREVERIAEELRPRFESGEFGGFKTGDGERQTRTPGFISARWRLEEEMRRRLGTSEVEACLVIAVSPSEYIGDDHEDCAADAATVDVLRVAFRRGWYKPEPEESPSAAELAEEVTP